MSTTVDIEFEHASQRCPWCKGFVAEDDTVCSRCGAAVPDRHAGVEKTRCSHCQFSYPSGFIACPSCGAHVYRATDSGKLRQCATCGDLIAQNQICLTCDSRPEIYNGSSPLNVNTSPKNRHHGELVLGAAAGDVRLGFVIVLAAFLAVIYVEVTVFLYNPVWWLALCLMLFAGKVPCNKVKQHYPYLGTGMSNAHWICSLVSVLFIAFTFFIGAAYHRW